MGDPVVHFEILSDGADELRAFYGELFDWQFQVMPEIDYGVIEAQGGTGIGGGIGPADGPQQVTFYVSVDDPQAYLDRIEAKGGKTVVPVTEIPNVVTYARFADPRGNVVGLVKS